MSRHVVAASRLRRGEAAGLASRGPSAEESACRCTQTLLSSENATMNRRHRSKALAQHARSHPHATDQPLQQKVTQDYGKTSSPSGLDLELDGPDQAAHRIGLRPEPAHGLGPADACRSVQPWLVVATWGGE
jgi:hypothetical protein